MRELIDTMIKQYVGEYPLLTGSQSRWQEPVIGYVNAADERFITLRETVSPTHALPYDFLPDARTVIAYFIPLRRLHRRQQ